MPARVRVLAALLGSALVASTLATVAAGAAADTARGQGGGGGDGGSLTFALEAENSGGYCLPDATLAASGIQVVTAIYDTLTALNVDGEVVPYLAESFEPNADFTEWTITLRDGVTFHDGTPLDAAALKLNIDTYRGVDGAPAITPRLTVFVFQDIASTEVTGPLSVKVTTKRPWVAFPAYWTQRYGIVAPAQLADRQTCATQPIGTGPFKFVEWRQNESLTVERNDDYWREGFPKVDEIVFRPVPEVSTRINGLTSGQFDLMTTSSSGGVIDLQDLAESGQIDVVATDEGAETAYLMLNSGKPPFDEKIARQAVASAGDAREVNEIRNRGLNTIATGPFPPDNDAFLEGIARKRNLKQARRLNEQYEQEHGEPIAFEYLTNPEPETLAIAQLVKEQQAEAGIEVTIRTVDQPTLVNEVLAGNFTGAGFRNHPGGDPDTQYVWWHSGSPVNFGRIDDPEIDRLLDAGRSEPDQAKRTEIYQDLSRHFAEELYNLWSWYTYWAVGYQTDVKGVAGPRLPDGGGRPFSLFAGVIPVLSLARS